MTFHCFACFCWDTKKKYHKTEATANHSKEKLIKSVISTIADRCNVNDNVFSLNSALVTPASVAFGIRNERRVDPRMAETNYFLCRLCAFKCLMPGVVIYSAEGLLDDVPKKIQECLQLTVSSLAISPATAGRN